MNDSPSLVDGLTSQPPRNATGQRILAGFVDLIPLFILFYVMADAFGTTGPNVQEGSTTWSVSLYGWPLVVYIFLAMGYYVVSEVVVGTTLGKRLLGLKVVKLNGEPYVGRAVLVRNVLRVVDGFPVMYMVGLVSIAISQRRQRLGDLAARTAVVRRE